MVCINCGSDRLIPILMGQPNSQAWNAMMRGLVCSGGSIVCGPERYWRCIDCCERTIADDEESYRNAVQKAIDASQEAVDSEMVDAVRGLQMAQRMVYLFVMSGVKSVKIVEATPQNLVFGMIDGEWAEYDWENIEYFPEMRIAFRHQMMPSQTIFNRQPLIVSVRELNDTEHGLLFEMNAPE